MKRILIIILLLLISTNVFADDRPGICRLSMSLSSNSIEAGEEFTVNISAQILGDYVGPKIIIDFHNGVTESVDCAYDNIIGTYDCNTSTTVSPYNNGGNYVITTEFSLISNDTGTQYFCTDSASINVAMPVCYPTPCDKNCPPGCTVSDDPDCGCASGNGCCGEGCTNINDSDCAGLSPSGDTLSPIREETLGGLIYSIINVLFYIGMVVFPLGIIAGGFVMLNSANINNISLGKKIILYSTVIFAIIIIIKSLAYFFKPDITFS